MPMALSLALPVATFSPVGSGLLRRSFGVKPSMAVTTASIAAMKSA